MMKARDNPFRVERLHALPYQSSGFDWDEFWKKLESFDRRGAIVGPRGHGKTTLLLEMEKHLRRRRCEVAWLKFSENGDHVAVIRRQSFRPGQFLLADGVEQLNTMQWRWLMWLSRKAQGFVVTTHEPGWLPTLHECRTALLLLDQLLNSLVGDTARQELWPRAKALFLQHEGNIREVFFSLYDEHALVSHREIPFRSAIG